MKRFFDDNSYWNTPIETGVETDPRSDHLISLLQQDDRYTGFGINVHKWTVPIYEAETDRSRQKVARRITTSIAGKSKASYSTEHLHPDHWFGHYPDFADGVPIPGKAEPDPENDAHVAIIDLEAGLAWDMWGATKNSEGQWEANSGMSYRLDGPGVFPKESFPVHNGESIHMYGPSRASGVPAIAGLIMYDEILSGKIEHKLAFATMYNAFQQFIHPPACWTDGWMKGDGFPEGCILQLDPDLDLDRFDLSDAARVIARALQEYGMSDVDHAADATLYAEGLPGRDDRSWTGILDPHALMCIGFEHYRVLKMENIINKGMGPWDWVPGQFHKQYEE